MLLRPRIRFSHIGVSALLLSLCACTEDSFLSGSSSDYVHFDVNVSEKIGSASRSDEVASNSLRLKGGEKSLFLHPKIIQGISVGADSNMKSASPTRSVMYSNSNLESCGVFATMVQDSVSSPSFGSDQEYMANVEVRKDNSWVPNQNYLWPSKGALHFNAYAPYCEAADSTGVTQLPSITSSGNLQLGFKTPNDVAQQFDLLYANPVNASSSPCNLVFNHALTAVRFVTGQEMVPCTVKDIVISGVKSVGCLDIESGLWSELASPSSFSVSPGVVLSASGSNKFVDSATDITAGDMTFLFIPQTLGDDAVLAITVSIDGVETKLETSLADVTWQAGMTTIYRLSVNPKEDSYILQVTDEEGNVISELNSNYTGSTLNFKIKSAFGDATDTLAQKNIPWKAEFIDDGGNVISKPQWISDWTMSAAGSSALSGVTTMQVPVFEALSEESQALRNAEDVNKFSGYSPYNLSNSTGQATVKNTANCYMVHAPGFYSLPLVYGNAIVDGATNSSAYTTTVSSNVHILKNFVNHLGVGITDPYIYNNANCTPADAVLVWEGRLNLVQNVKLSSDKTRLLFTISPDFICQGNAIVAVRNADGIIMWSWHLWVTPYLPEDNAVTIAYHGKNYELMSQNLGQISSGDRANFAARSVKIRYSQVPDDGSEPLSVVIELNQSGKIVTTPDSYNYYQWGRKDPMVSDVAEWYTSDYQEVTKIWTKSFLIDRTPDIPIIADYIRTPGYFWVSSTTEEVFPYYNLWNTNNSTTNEVKTIYDPSPVGYLVARNVLTALNNGASVPTTGKFGVGVNVTVPGTSDVIFFPTHGYRDSNTGSLEGIASGHEIGTVWASRTTSTTEASALVISVNTSKAALQGGEVRTMGFGVRSSKQL